MCDWALGRKCSAALGDLGKMTGGGAYNIYTYDAQKHTSSLLRNTIQCLRSLQSPAPRDTESCQFFNLLLAVGPPLSGGAGGTN